MCKIRTCIAVFLLISAISARRRAGKETLQCLQVNQMTIQEYVSLAKAKEKPEKYFCTAKCIVKTFGVFDDEGGLIFDKIKQMPEIRRLAKDQQATILACLETIGKIETCGDIKKWQNCFVLVKAQGTEKCLEDNKLTNEEYVSLARAKEPPENYYCTEKCIMKVHGAITANDDLVIDKIKQTLFFRTLARDNQKKVLACLETLGKFESCQHMKQLNDCLASGENEDVKQFRKCLEDNELSVQEFLAFEKVLERPEKFYCAQKCMLKSNGVLNDDGGMDFAIIKNSSQLKTLAKTQQTNVVACLEKLGKIETCQHVKQFQNCYDSAMQNLAKEIQKCLDDNKMTTQEFAGWLRPKQDRPENFYCAHKCVMEHRDVLSKDGEINLDAIEHLESTRIIPKEYQQRVLGCLAKIGKIEACEEVKKLHDCYEAVRLTPELEGEEEEEKIEE